MLYDSLKVVPGGTIVNASIEKGNTLPAITGLDEGRQFRLLQDDGQHKAGFYVVISGAWTEMGDITAVLAGNGLVGGAVEGAATLSIDEAVVVTHAALDAALADFTPGGGGVNFSTGSGLSLVDGVLNVSSEVVTQQQLTAAVAGSGNASQAYVDAKFTGALDDFLGMTLKEYIDDGDASASAGVQSLITAGVNAGLTTALGYSTVAQNNAVAQARTYTNQQVALNLQSAKDYADTTSVDKAKAGAKVYSDSADALILAQAKAYADTINQVATNERDYVDTNIASTLTTLRAEFAAADDTLQQNINTVNTTLTQSIADTAYGASMALQGSVNSINISMGQLSTNLTTYTNQKVAASASELTASIDGIEDRVNANVTTQINSVHDAVMSDVTAYLAAHVPSDSEVLTQVDAKLATQYDTITSEQHSYTNSTVSGAVGSAVTSLTTSYVAADTAVLNSANSHANANLAEAKAYANSILQDLSVNGFSTFAANQLADAKAEAISTSETFTNQQVTAMQSSLNASFSASISATALAINTSMGQMGTNIRHDMGVADANLASDIVQCLADAKAYVDTKTLTSVRKDYVDSKDSQVLSDAKAYADIGLVTAQQGLQAYTDAQMEAAVTQANDYADSLSSSFSIGDGLARTSGQLSVNSTISRVVDVDAAIAAARAYTDTKVAGVSVSVGTGLSKNGAGVISADTTVLATRTYADGVKTYADAGDSATLQSAKAYADSVANVSVGKGLSKTGSSIALADAYATYDFTGFVASIPADSTIAAMIAGHAYTIGANFSGSYAKSSAAATSTTVFTVLKNGASIGTITFAAAATAGTFSTTTAVSVAAGDLIELRAQTVPDSTLAGFTFLIAGTLS